MARKTEILGPYPSPGELRTCLEEGEEELRVFFKVRPGAKQSRFEGVHDGRIKLALKAPPVEGKANQALIRGLARFLDLPKSRIRIHAGAKDRRKTLAFSGLEIPDFLARWPGGYDASQP